MTTASESPTIDPGRSTMNTNDKRVQRAPLLAVALCGCGYFSGGGGTDGAGGTGPEVPHVGDVDACGIISEHSGMILEDGNFPTRPTWMGSPGNWLNPTFSEAGLFTGFIWANGNSGEVVISPVDGTLTIGERAWDDGPVVWIHLDGNAAAAYQSGEGLWPELELSNLVQPDGSIIAWGVRPAAAINGASAYFNTTTSVRGVSTVYGSWKAGPAASNLKSVTPTTTPTEPSFRPSLGTCSVVPAALDDGPIGDDGADDDPIDDGDNPLCYAIGGDSCVTRDSWTVSTIHDTVSDYLTPVGSGAWANRTIHWDPDAGVSGSWRFDEPDVDGPAFVKPQPGAQLTGLEWWPGDFALLEDDEVLSYAWLMGGHGCTFSLTFYHGPETEIVDATEIPLAGAWGGMSGYVAPIGHFGDLADTLDYIHMGFAWDPGDCEIAGLQTSAPMAGKLLPKVGDKSVLWVTQYWVPYGGVVSFDAG